MKRVIEEIKTCVMSVILERTITYKATNRMEMRGQAMRMMDDA
jgi:hypothetical protein